jgi:hypothetical protein
MCNSYTRSLLLAFALIAASCGDPEENLFGFNTTGVEFVFYKDTEGIFPSPVTLSNPANPFREYSIGSATKFALLTDGGNAGGFYAWATVLAREPTGENQYYTAVKLRDLYEANEVAADDIDTVRQMAIDGFQIVLDCFPESVSYDTTGTFYFKLATLAFEEIIGLQGVPQGDWALVLDAEGIPTAVQSSQYDAQAREVRCY